MDAMIEYELDKMEKEGQQDTTDKDLEELMLNPLYINHQPTEQEIEKSIGLKGIQALLYNGPLNEQQTTYKTQGNTCLQHALKTTDLQEKINLLNTAIKHYNTALSIKLEPTEQLNQQEIDTKYAIILANRSEVNRLLQNYKQAISDAAKAIQLDKSYCKSYCRLGAIFNDLNELQASMKWYLNGAQHAETVKQKQQIEKICKDLEKQIEEINNSYKTTEMKIKEYSQYKNIKLGKLLNFFQMSFEQIIQSWQKDTISLYLVEDKSREIMTVNDCNLNLTVSQIRQIIQIPQARFCYYTNWTYQLIDGKLQEQSTNTPEKKVLQDYISLKILLNQKDYIVPGVVNFNFAQKTYLKISDISDGLFCPKCGCYLKQEEKSIYCIYCKEHLPKQKGMKTIQTKEYQHKDIKQMIEEKENRPTTDQECPKCGNRKCYYFAMQTRSADEGQTVFYECCKCSERFQLNT